jgi:hypothetical protein
MKGDNMTAASKPPHIQMNEPQSPVPEIRCPRCQGIMRLATIEPMASSGENKMLFECRCGVEQRRPEPASSHVQADGGL